MRERRRRALRVVVPVAAAVVVATAIVGWFAAQPDTDTTQPRGRTHVVFLGNSFTGGSLMDSGPNSRWPAIVSKKLDLSDSVITADGSGYVTPGTGLARFQTLAAKVPHDAKAVVILGSDDDASASYADIKAAALKTFAEVHSRAPQAKILAIATFWVNANPPEGILQSRDAVRDAAQEAGVSFADPLAEKWLVADPSQTIGSDGLHPTDAGQAELARWIEPLIAALLGRSAG